MQAVVTMHSYGDSILYSYGYAMDARPPNVDEIVGQM